MCRFEKSKTSTHSLDIYCNDSVTITGFSFFLSPGSDVRVDISIQSRYGGSYSQQTEHIQNNGPRDVVPIHFKEPYKHTVGYNTSLSLSITGTGVGPVGINTREKNNVGYFDRTVDGRDKNGSFVREVKFSYNGEKVIICDIFFHID